MTLVNKNICFEYTFLWYIICTLQCVPTTPSQIFFRHHVFDPLYPLPPPPTPFSLVTTLLMSASMSFICFSALFTCCFQFYIPHEWNHMVLNFFYVLFCLAWYSRHPSVLLWMAVFHLFLWLSSIPLYIYFFLQVYHPWSFGSGVYNLCFCCSM